VGILLNAKQLGTSNNREVKVKEKKNKMTREEGQEQHSQKVIQRNNWIKWI
jgi:hypothetical protein